MPHELNRGQEWVPWDWEEMRDLNLSYKRNADPDQEW